MIDILQHPGQYIKSREHIEGVFSLQETVDRLYQGKTPGNEVERLLQERRLAAESE